jgi:hypothetical protein
MNSLNSSACVIFELDYWREIGNLHSLENGNSGVVKVVTSTRNVESRGPGTSICLQVCYGSYEHVAGWRVINRIESAQPAPVLEQRSK